MRHRRLRPPPWHHLLITGRIATFAGDAGFGWVEAVGIREGKIAFAGSAVDLESRADPHTRRIALEPGEIAIPALTDAHLHLAGAALAAEQVDLATAPTLDEGLARIRAMAERLPEDAWILGGGWDQRRWGGWPSAGDLESVVPGRKVAVRSFDHHALWASHAALGVAGVGGETPDPAGGIIQRGNDGAPTGALLENATSLVIDRVPPPDDETAKRSLRSFGRQLLALGVAGAHDPGSLAPDATGRALDVYIALAEAGELPVRVHAAVRSDGLDDAIARGLRSGAAMGEGEPGWLTFGWLKLFADGTLASRTAALLAPIEGGAETGMYTTPPDVLRERATKAATAGIATQIHAIGDAAVRTSLDVLGPTVSKVRLMPRLEHIQLCDPDDRARFAQLGIGASVQPVHLRDDAATARRDWGPRAESAGYTWRSLLDAGAVLGFGTDAPVEPIDPWPGVAMAVLRRDPSWGPDAPPYGPDEALTLEQTLRASTVGPATFARDPLGGRLVPGSRADLIVLPAAPQEPEQRAAAFAQVRPRLVLVNGQIEVER
jgi:predicted amidohydrolase YtcJ